MIYLEEEKLNVVLNKMKDLIKNFKYNNKIIEKMSTDMSISHYFKKFLQSKA